jgi:putative peptidoglycan lipid II flippase
MNDEKLFIYKSAIFITLITLFSKIIGFFREIILAYTYGTSYEADAFLLALSIAGIATAIFFAALKTAYIPVYSNLNLNNSYNEVKQFVNVSYTYVLIIVTVLSFVSFVFAQNLVNLFAPGIDQETRELTTTIVRIVQFTVILSAIIELNNARLQVHKVYLVPIILGFASNLIMIIHMLVFKNSVIGLSIAFSIGILMQLVLQIPFLFKKKLFFKVSLSFKDKNLKKFIRLVIPIVIGTAIYEINVIVDKILASSLPIGSISALSYGSKLVLFFTSILAASVTSVFFTSMTNYNNKKEVNSFGKMFESTFIIIFMVSIPTTMVFVVFSKQIIAMIFQYGMFDTGSTDLTSSVFLYYSIAIPFIAIRDVLNRTLYSINAMKSATINGSIAVVINILLSIILVRIMGISGLALATSISTIIGSILLFINVKNRKFAIRNKFLLKRTILILFAASTSIFFSYISFTYSQNFTNSLYIRIGISMVIFLLFYLSLILVFRFEEVDIILKKIIKRKEK